MKNTLKGFISFLLVVSMVLSLTGCGEIEKAENTVKGMFEAFKKLDLEKTRQYIITEDVTTFENKDITDNQEIIIKKIVDNLDYEIVSSEKADDNTVNVKTKITTIDMKPVIKGFLKEAMQYAISSAFTEPKISEEEMNKKIEEMFIQNISKSDLAVVTKEVVIKVVKTIDNDWKIDVDDSFLNSLLGGLIEASEELENSLKK